MPLWACFLKPRKLRLELSKSTLIAENFLCSFSMSTSIGFGTICSWNVSRSPKSPKIHYKPLFWHSRSSKVTEFGGNRKPEYDFLLVIKSNLGSMSHRYWDTATYWLKIAIFPTPPSYLARSFGVTLWIYGKALQFLKLESSRQLMVQIWWS